MKRYIHGLTNQKCTSTFGIDMLSKKERIYELVLYWLTHNITQTSLDELASKFFDTILNEPVSFVVRMDCITFFKDPLFDIPLREVKKRELICIHSLLQKNMFTGKVVLDGFQLKYSNFKYNAILDQRIDRTVFIQMFLEVCLAYTGAAQQSALRSVLSMYCQSAATEFKLKGHPCHTQLVHLSRLYNNQKINDI